MNYLVWESVVYDNLNFAGVCRHGITLIGNELYIFGGLYHSKYQQTLYKLIDEGEVVSIDEAIGIIPE